jgi:outer membrane protein OmpA-like peptidoglycan-associated protein/tetratricopeptide (TPR) repeat protein
MVLVLSPVAGQDKIDKQNLSAKQLKNFGKAADLSGDIYSAIDFLEPYCKLRANDDAMHYRLAQLYFASRDYQKAEKQFAKVYKEWGADYPEALYYQAESMKSQGKYAEAKEVFTKFQRKLKSVKDPTITLSLLKDEMTGCDIAQTLIDNPLKVTIGHMNSTINGMHIELSPVALSDSLLLYSSLRIDTGFYFNRDDTARIPVRQFYTAHREGADWTGGKLYDAPINIPGVETGNGAFSRDGNRLYFTRCAKDWQGKIRCDIYVSQRAGKKWQEPMKLNALVNDPNYTTTQPAVGYTAKSNLEVVYFVSNRPGGHGGLDIWYTVYNPRKKEYSAPRNAGSKINTPGNEMTPFYDHLTRTLYFSSNGHSGLGGYDVFQAVGELRKWFDPRNVGYPINSSYDDLYFTISKSRENGFLVSNRPGGNSFRNPTCCDDIYQYRWSNFIRITVTGAVYPAESSKLKKNMDQSQLLALVSKTKPLDKAVLSLYMIDKESKEKIFIDRDTTGANGVYFFDLLPDREYKLEMEGFQYFNEQVNISTSGIDFSYNIEMPPIWVSILNDKPIVLKNVYYEFDKSELTALAKQAIDTTLLELMNKATDIIVEVGAHTDSIGNYQYNKKLSQDRADNVVKYLVDKGINTKRLMAKGYGAEKPVAPNYKPDGSDNPEGREKNRRTEFRVIGTLSSRTEDIDTEETQ